MFPLFQAQIKQPTLCRPPSLLTNTSPILQSKKSCKINVVTAFVAVLCFVLIISNHIDRELFVSPRPVAAVKDLEAEFRKSNMTHPPPPSLNLVDYREIKRGKDSFKFNMSASDVMVFLHIQKTGGTTFGRHLVQNIDLSEPCMCKEVPHTSIEINCNCSRPGNSRETWLFSRYSSGWPCGVHPDWTELTSCVDGYLNTTEGRSERRYFYVTFLRSPVSRFLSELRNVQRGATWPGSKHVCNGRPPSLKELPKCYEGPDWRNVEIEEFMACYSNLAINRRVPISQISTIPFWWLKITIKDKKQIYFLPL